MGLEPGAVERGEHQPPLLDVAASVEQEQRVGAEHRPEVVGVDVAGGEPVGRRGEQVAGRLRGAEADEDGPAGEAEGERVAVAAAAGVVEGEQRGLGGGRQPGSGWERRHTRLRESRRRVACSSSPSIARP